MTVPIAGYVHLESILPTMLNILLFNLAYYWELSEHYYVKIFDSWTNSFVFNPLKFFKIRSTWMYHMQKLCLVTRLLVIIQHVIKYYTHKLRDWRGQIGEGASKVCLWQGVQGPPQGRIYVIISHVLTMTKTRAIKVKYWSEMHIQSQGKWNVGWGRGSGWLSLFSD